MDTRQHSPDEIPPDDPEYEDSFYQLSIDVLAYDGRRFGVVWYQKRWNSDRGNWIEESSDFDAGNLKAWWYLPEYKG